MHNQIIEKYATHQDFAPWVDRAIGEVYAAAGFQRDGELQRRVIYDPNKVWRVRVSGTYEGRSALLRIENLKLEIDEERIRGAFRAQCAGSRVRPPLTYKSAPFDDAKGYAWSIDEDVVGPVLFDPSGDPSSGSSAFAEFYRELRRAIREPFWTEDSGDAAAFSAQQLDNWLSTARQKNPDAIKRHEPLLARLRDRIQAGVTGRELHFMHAHLSGWDVRLANDGTYVVFANHFWSWRQPGYDVAFPLWGQWMALPPEQRTAESVRAVTDTWLTMVHDKLADIASRDEVRAMLFNRLFGSLILDIPAQRHDLGDEAVTALEQACVAEAGRLLGE